MLVRRLLQRRPGRSAMLTAAVAVAVALLVALQSLAAGFLAAQTAEVRERAVDAIVQPLATRGDPRETGPQAAGIDGAHAFAAELARIPGVSSASPVLEAFLVARSGGDATLVLAQGVVPAAHLEGLSPTQRAKFDGYFTSAREATASGEVVVNDALAMAAGVAKGDELELAASATDPPARFRVVGVFQTPYTGTGILGGVHIALFHLAELQALVDVQERDAATRVMVRLEDAARASEAETARVVAAMREARAGFQVVTKEDELRDARERAAVSAGFYTAVAYVSLAVSALFVGSVMVMEVQERRRDLGVLRALGWSRASLFRGVALQALAFVVAGTLLGIGLGYFASEALGGYFRRGYGLDVAFTAFTPTLALLSAAQSLVVGILAALYPAYRATRVDALDVIRRAV
ncbi:MAG TPA: FtsX-like permease family protein [Candidatus Thermoplasmatota archaeon]|nr:FtsX-like permease family protein [Candidatus Thermoplasmatota archaeon]